MYTNLKYIDKFIAKFLFALVLKSFSNDEQICANSRDFETLG